MNLTEENSRDLPPRRRHAAGDPRGGRPISAGPGRDWQLSLYTPVIVKYRDPKTERGIQLEDLLR